MQPIRQDFGISGTLIGGYLADRLAREGYGNANLRYGTILIENQSHHI